MKELERQLREAVEKEEYSKAAELRDQIQAAKAADPVARLKAALEEAIEEEKYEEAAQLRDELKQAEKEQMAQLIAITSSDSVTQGVRVQVQSFFVPSQSAPERGMWFFAYRVSIKNEGPDTVVLRTRKWIITDANGEVQTVSGPGVVGEHPVLSPGESFTYTSACPLKTPTGYMEGHYGMERKLRGLTSSREEGLMAGTSPAADGEGEGEGGGAALEQEAPAAQAGLEVEEEGVEEEEKMGEKDAEQDQRRQGGITSDSSRGAVGSAL